MSRRGGLLPAFFLFLAGCEENQARFHPRFDHIVLLTAPLPTLVERLASRTTNAYGRSPEEFQRFLADVEQVEPLLRRAADHVVDTTVSPAGVVAAVLDLVGESDS